MKISEYPTLENPKSDDTIIVDGGVGTKKMSLGDVKKFVDPVVGDVEVDHRRYRGKYLGSEYTSEQQEAVQSGTFEDLYVGDYWTKNSINYRIADINVLNLATKANHLVIVPDDSLLSGPYVTSDNVFGGDINSNVFKSLMPEALKIINTIFDKEHIGLMSQNLSNSVNSSTGEAASFISSSSISSWPISICQAFGHTNLEKDTVNDAQIPAIQFALFRQNPKFIRTNHIYWISSQGTIYSNSLYMLIVNTYGSYGTLNYANAKYSSGYRPKFALI